MSATKLPPRQRQINLFVRHEDDDAARDAFVQLHDLARSGAADPFVGIVVQPGGELWDAWLLGKVDPEPVELLDALAGVRVLERVRLLGVSCIAEAELMAQELANGIRLVRLRLEQTKGRKTTLTDVRVQALSLDEQITNAGIFSPAALNVALMPHDRSSDLSSARLVSRDADGDRFRLHVATELATLSGLWTPLRTAPVDEWRSHPSANDELQVRFSRSLVRALFCPPLPIDRVVPPGDPLPVPAGFQPTPNIAATVNAVARSTFPEGLRFVPSLETAYHVDMPLAAVLKAIPGRMVDIVKSLPRVLRDGIGRDIESLAGDGIQGMIGRESWLRVAFRDRQDPSGMSVWTSSALESMAQLEMVDEMPVMSDVPSTIWTDMIARVLGVADGSSASADARVATGEERFLITAPYALVNQPEESAVGTVRALVDALDSDPNDAGSDPLDQAAYPGGWSGEELPPPQPLPPPSIDEFDEVVATDDDGWSDEASPEPEPEPHDEEAAPPSDEFRYAPAPRPSIRDALSSSSSMSIPAGGLVGAITEQFVDEKRAADQQLSSMFETMRGLVEESQNAEGEMTVPKRVRFGLAVSTMAIIFASLVFTGASKYADLSWMSLSWRVFCWVLFSAAVVVPSYMVLGKKPNLGPAYVFLAIVLLGIASAAAFVPWVRDRDFIAQYIGRTYWPMWPISVAVVITGLCARASGADERGTWRGALGRFVAWVTCAYLLAVLVVGASSWKSVFQPVSRIPEDVLTKASHFTDDFRQKILLLAYIFGLLAIVGCLLRIAVLWVRIEYRNRNRGQRFQFAVDEAQQSSRSRRRLQVLTAQWLGTASALSRVVWAPLGPLVAAEDTGRDELVAANELLKFDAAGLDLTPRGDAMMLARLRSILIHPGWLLHQYQRAADAFMATDPTLLDQDTKPEARPTPETCPAVIPLEEILANRTMGRRWDFAEALYQGYLDEALNKVITENKPEKIFESVLRDPTAHRTIGAIDEDADLITYFEGILPQGPQELPTGLSSVVFTASDPKRSMDTYLAWPQDFIPRQIDHAIEMESAASGLFEGAVIMAARLDVSKPFGLSEIADFTWDNDFGDSSSVVTDPGYLL
jgi:hypothetical protein